MGPLSLKLQSQVPRPQEDGALEGLCLAKGGATAPIQPSLQNQACVTGYHRLGGLQNRIYGLTVLEATV